MKKKVIISIIIILVIIILGVGGFFAYKFLNKDEEKEKEVDNSAEEIYSEYIKGFDIKGTYGYDGIGVSFIDLNADSIPEMLIGDGTFNLYPKIDEIKVLSIENNEVKEITSLNKTRLLCLVYDIQNDKYLYGVQNLAENEGAEKTVVDIELIENLNQSFTKYTAQDKEYMKNYITIPDTEKIKNNLSIDVFYGNEGKSDVKKLIKQRIDSPYTIEKAREICNANIEKLKQENENKLNAPDTVEAQNLGRELLQYTENIYSNCKLSETQEPVGGEFGQELLNYEEAFENKFTDNFIQKYWNAEGTHYYLKDVNGKKYLITPGIGDNVSYIGEEMVLKEVTSEKITFEMVGYFLSVPDDRTKLPEQITNFKEELDNNQISYTTNVVNFVIVKDGDNWKVDEFTDLRV